MNKKKEKFKLIKLLGIGGFAQTYLVEVIDQKLKAKWGKQVAIKIPLNKEKEKTLISELITNASLHLNLQGIKAKNIIKYLGFEVFDGKYIMVMEYAQGKDLRSILGDVGNQQILLIDQALDIAMQVCDGLIEIHDLHIYHRDIKPENIMVCDDGVVKIMDLGISRMISSTQLASTTSGSLFYMPKEILKGKGGSFFSDIYSLGVTMYEMLTGEIPFNGNSIGTIIDKICHSEPIPPQKLNDEIDDDLNKIILKSIDKDINKRYKTARELKSALEEYKKHLSKEIQIIEQNIAEAQELLYNFKLKEAEEKLKRLIKEYPNVPKCYLGLGEFYNRCQKYKEAITIFKKGIQLNPNFSLFYRDIALSYYKKGNEKEAISNLKKSIELGLENSLDKHARQLLQLWQKK